MIAENKTLTLTEDQQEAFDQFKHWLTGGSLFGSAPSMGDDEDNYMTLVGYAGTGKTTLLDYFVQYARERGRRVAVTATTNKALKVLIDKVDHNTFMTIHSLLNIKPVKEGTKEVFKQVTFNKKDISVYDLVIVEECSMISEKLLEIIKDQVAKAFDLKVLFCGDSAQLQPVNEQKSKCFQYSSAKLSKIVRHGDTIAQKSKIVRDNTESIKMDQLIHPPEISKIGVSEAKSMFTNFREDPDNTRMLCWTNKTVLKWNRTMRRADFGEGAPQPFAEEDIIMANSPCKDGEEIIMLNSEEGVVRKVIDKENYYELEVRKLYDNSLVTLRVIKRSYKSEHEKKMKVLAANKQWNEYWFQRERYHDIRHCYALTTHKSQGSTFNNVVMDVRDMYKNRDVQERNQLLYVAMTRASERVFILER